MTSNDDFVLASGVAYFRDDFKALPYVVDALTTRSSTSDILKADLLLVEKKLANMLNSSSGALLDSTSSLSVVSKEFDASRAQIRDLRRRVAASMASFSGRRRDLNALSFRKAQIESALLLLEKIIACIQACHGPVSIEGASNLKKVMGLLPEIPEEISLQLQVRLQERKIAVSKLIKSVILESLSGKSNQDERLFEHITSLKDLDELDLEEFKANLNLPSPPSMQEVVLAAPLEKPIVIASFTKPMFLMFPDLDSILIVENYIKLLIDWADLLLSRSAQFDAVIKLIGVPQKIVFHAETLKLVEERLEKELRPILDVYTQKAKTYVPKAPRHFIRHQTSLNKPVFQGGFQPSPYFLTFIHDSLFKFSEQRGLKRLQFFLQETCETSLRSLINRDISALFELNPNAKASEFIRSTTRLEQIVLELRTSVFSKISGLDVKMLLQDISTPVIHALKKRIDSAVDSASLALIAKSSKFVSSLRKNPLFLAIESRRRGDEPPTRSLLIETSFDYLKESSLDIEGYKEETEKRKSSQLFSDLPTLIALHSCLHRLAKSISEEKTEFASLGDYCLFCACADILLELKLVESDIQLYASMIRFIRTQIENWVESPAVFDFIFLPLCFSICMKIVNEPKLTLDDIFILRNAFAAALVGASVDPFGDLDIFDSLFFKIRLRDVDKEDEIIPAKEHKSILETRLSLAKPALFMS